MKTVITLNNRAGELDRVVLGKRDATDDEIKAALQSAIAEWTIQVGDVIRITEE